jgi:hypothetical protein
MLSIGYNAYYTHTFDITLYFGEKESELWGKIKKWMGLYI